MECSNGFCNNKGSFLSFACKRCRQQKYCSQLCMIEDWNSSHSLICEKTRIELLRKTEIECPFIKIGKLLSSNEADRIVPKTGVYEKYEVVEQCANLGKGSYGKVILMRDKATNNLVAVKIINKNGIKDKREMQALVNEIGIQKRMVHENIIRLISHFEDSKNIYIVMEYAKGGSLFRVLRKKRRFTEKDAFFFFVQACSAVHFLHIHHFMHRDIKPENLLVTDMGRLKLCDFGCCAKDDDKGRINFCGTIEYMAPEVIRKEYCNEKADIWSLGILLYEMLHGYAPYHGKNDKTTIYMILNRKPRFFDIKEDAKDLISSMLNSNAEQRPEVWEVFSHPWVKRMQREFGILETTKRRASNNLLTGRTNNRRNEFLIDNSNYAEIYKTQIDKGPISKSLIYHQKLASNVKALKGQFTSNNEVNKHASDINLIDNNKLKEQPVTPKDTPISNPRIISDVVIERDIEVIFSDIGTDPYIEKTKNEKESYIPLVNNEGKDRKKTKGSESTLDECIVPKTEPSFKQINSLTNTRKRKCVESFTDALEEVRESEGNESATRVVRVSGYVGGTSKARRASVVKRGASTCKTRNNLHNLVKKAAVTTNREESSIWNLLMSFGRKKGPS